MAAIKLLMLHILYSIDMFVAISKQAPVLLSSFPLQLQDRTWWQQHGNMIYQDQPYMYNDDSLYSLKIIKIIKIIIHATGDSLSRWEWFTLVRTMDILKILPSTLRNIARRCKYLDLLNPSRNESIICLQTSVIFKFRHAIKWARPKNYKIIDNIKIT